VTAEISHPTCIDSEDGMIAVSFPFLDNVSYHWNTNQSTSSIENLSAATYTLSLTDDRGQLLLDTFFILEAQTSINLTTSSTPEINGTANGTATAVVAGGTPPYLYNWNTTPTQTTSTASNLTAGDYTVVVTDQNGCTESMTVMVDITTDILSIEQLGKFTLTPNPTQSASYAHLTFNKPTRWHLHLSNILGQPIKNYQHKENELTNARIRIADLENGLYYVRLVIDGVVISTKALVVVR